MPDTNIFKTDRLNTAVYLHASKLLPYVGIRRVNHFKVEFAFEDADHKAAEIERNFESRCISPRHISPCFSPLLAVRHDGHDAGR